jgi:hypothetical protein
MAFWLSLYFGTAVATERSRGTAAGIPPILLFDCIAYPVVFVDPRWSQLSDEATVPGSVGDDRRYFTRVILVPP